MSDPMPAREKRVADRALDLWRRAGKPPDKDGYFWAQAEREVAEEIQREAGGAFVPLAMDPQPPGRPPLAELDKSTSS